MVCALNTAQNIAPARLQRSNINRFDIAVPLLALALAVVADYSGLNLQLAALFFDAAQGVWPARDGFIASTLLHQGGKDLAVLGGVALLVATGLSWTKPQHQIWRAPLLAGFVGSLLACGIIAILKSRTHMACPWDVSNFGGTTAYLRLFDSTPSNMSIGHCFPAGHASSGYAWLVLWFALRPLLSSMAARRLLLGSVLVGMLFGIAQQVRGAHFLTHDLVTFAICWCVGIVVRVGLNRKSTMLSPSAAASDPQRKPNVNFANTFQKQSAAYAVIHDHQR